MNIFVLDRNPIRAAAWQHDRHVVKMILESSQILSTAIQQNDLLGMIFDDCSSRLPASIRTRLYKPTHIHHPCVKWAESPDQFVWLVIHLESLHREYGLRFGKTHKCKPMFMVFAAMAGKLTNHGYFASRQNQYGTLVTQPVYQFAMHHDSPIYCGPDRFDRGSTPERVVDSYRRYYIECKVSGNRWTQHPLLFLPEWLAPHATIHRRVVEAPAKRRKAAESAPYVHPEGFAPVPKLKFLNR